MYPIVLDLKRFKVALVGNDRSAVRRLAKLDAAGAQNVLVFADDASEELVRCAGARLVRRMPCAAELAEVKLLLITDVPDNEAAALAATARAMGILVNVEDRKPWCDFHHPSVTRRGDLVIAVSTNGKSPGLSRRVRQFIEGLLGPEWQGRVEEIAARREKWRARGADMPALMELTDELVERRRWLR